jgi:hypothetical protein
MRHDTTRHDKNQRAFTFPSVNTQAKYSLLSIPTTLTLSLPVGDGIMWIRACKDHERIFCRVVSYRAVPCNVNRPLFGRLQCRQKKKKQQASWNYTPDIRLTNAQVLCTATLRTTLICTSELNTNLQSPFKTKQSWRLKHQSKFNAQLSTEQQESLTNFKLIISSL